MKPFNDTYVMYWLLEFIDESSIIGLCKASKKLNEICKQYIELEDDKRFEVIVDDDLFENYCEKTNVIKIRKMIEIGLDWNYALWCTCGHGHIDIVKLLIEKGANSWNSGLCYACHGGHMDIVKFMIEKGADNWRGGLEGACRGGHMNIVKLMIEKGASDWNHGLEYACGGGHIDIVKLMIEKGATRCEGEVSSHFCDKTMEEHLS